MKKIINIGIVAHVDAGKTTITENLLYYSGAIKSVGRVDLGNTQTDSMELERKRGITIKSSTISFNWNNVKVNIVDTPGHVDFISEVERSLSVLDGAILVISGVEGIQSQTRILFETLKELNIPTIIFVNKLDRIGANFNKVFEDIKKNMSNKVVRLQEVYDVGSKAVYIKKLNDVYNMIVHFPVKPQEEATDSIELFLPFAILSIIIISFAISSLYSILISGPLIKLNKVAKRMANLDFNNTIEINGKDEIGELSNSLNLMNKNLKEAFEQLEKINFKLTKEIEMERKLEKERREFVATISHELKSPITIISGQLEGMIYNIGKYKDRDKYLKESYDVTQKMKELVQEILHLSERENGEFKYNFTYVRLSNVMNSVINELRYFIDEKNLKLQINIDENVIVFSDSKLIKKVITNIVKNAITYSPENEFIKINLSREELVIENTGISIPEEQLKYIFNAFYRVDKSRNRKTGGTGLGLYIVKTILDKHENIDCNIESTKNSVIFKMKFKYN